MTDHKIRRGDRVLKKIFLLTAFDDDNYGGIGWGLGDLDTKFDDFMACQEGNLLAHDILEHNHDSTLEGIENELEAIGAADWIRGDIDISHDVVAMARQACYDRITAGDDTVNHNVYEDLCADNMHNILGECDLDCTEERKNLSEYLRHAGQHISNGRAWAEEYYARYNPHNIRTAIIDQFIEAEYAGQQMEVHIDFTKNTVWFSEVYEDFDDPYDNTAGM